jgi:mono/diheme cytochrome c family protein
MKIPFSVPFCAIWVGVFAAAWVGRPCASAAEGGPVVFQRDVLPILSNNCFSCHGFDASGREAGLRLDLREGATSKLDSGAQAIVPEKPDASELIRRIESEDESELMPPKKSGRTLTPQQREILRRWIAQGAEYQKHWAFEPPVKRDPPAVADAEHPIDRFLQQRLSAEGLKPSPTAIAETLIRRVSLDLTGLPPTIAEIDAFLTASKADPDAAYRDLVERLLASPHYGERWGRWWLDQARYADSNGYSIDGPRQIWKYRDWVIDAFNRDLPFDQFTLEQLAGDLLPSATQEQKIATGFHRNTQINQEGGIDREQFRIDSVFDRVATTGSVWLGLTVGCAQCHDHKFDPITQKEYYQLFAFLNNQDEPTLKVYGPGVNVSELTKQLQEAEKHLTKHFSEHAEQLAAWEQSLDEAAKKKLPNPVKTAQAVAPKKRSFAQNRTLFAISPLANDQQFIQLNENYAKLDTQLNSVATTLVMQETAKPRTTTVFIKGDFTRPADVVSPGTPSLLHPFENQTSKANRIDLARWLTSRNNPLTARVIVNRVWQQYFGRGIVETDNDFGAQGSPPSHPELLDWLAISFMENGWQIKDLHRIIVSSQAYQQSSVERADLREKDPHNYLLGRQRRLRLDAEIIRDVALTASGLLAPKLGGPPVYPPIPDGVMGVGQVKHAWPVSTGADRYRRGCYTFAFRATPPPALNVFDAPDGYSSCTRRLRSNTPLQALTLLNDGACLEFAGALESIIRKDGLEIAFRRCTSRSPATDELALLKALDAPSAARVLLNLDETITRE